MREGAWLYCRIPNGETGRLSRTRSPRLASHRPRWAVYTPRSGGRPGHPSLESAPTMSCRHPSIAAGPGARRRVAPLLRRVQLLEFEEAGIRRAASFCYPELLGGILLARPPSVLDLATPGAK